MFVSYIACLFPRLTDKYNFLKLYLYKCSFWNEILTVLYPRKKPLINENDLIFFYSLLGYSKKYVHSQVLLNFVTILSKRNRYCDSTVHLKPNKKLYQWKNQITKPCQRCHQQTVRKQNQFDECSQKVLMANFTSRQSISNIYYTKTSRHYSD